MNIILIVATISFLAGFLLLGFWFWQNRKLGILKNKPIYTDLSEKTPGEILYSKIIPLSGKPDALIKEGNMVYPVEIKTGHTPTTPYLNHTTQLMAYCLLVEENYGVRPVGGYLKYPSKEFKIAYTDEGRQSVIDLVREMLEIKKTNQMQYCKHPEHNR